MTIGVIVILSCESNRLGWKLGGVVAFEAGDDKLVRSVNVECYDAVSFKQVKRCITHTV